MLSDFPVMLLIGAASKHAGKTELACRIIGEFCAKTAVSAAKVTVIDKPGDSYSLIKGPYVITVETDPSGNQDTCRMLKAGAGRVLWLRVMRESLREGVEALAGMMDRNTAWVCESNSIRQFIRPGVFLMVTNEVAPGFKPSAEQMREQADRMVSFVQADFSFSLNLDRLSFENNRWCLRENASAAILAGGRGSRMGSDKSLLSVQGRPMIEHVAAQLRGHFNELLISSGRADDYSFLGLPVVADAEAGRGPLAGIAAVLRNTSSDLNFITACDIPDINMPFVRKMLRMAVEGDWDAVVPRRVDGCEEPLYAVYNMRIAKTAENLLNEGEYKVRALFNRCRTGYIEFSSFDIRNLNAKKDYEDYCLGRNNALL